MLRNIISRRSIWLMVALMLAIVVVTRWTLPDQDAFLFLTSFGYWFMLALVLLAGRAFFRVGAGHWCREQFCRFDAAVLLLISLISAVWWSHERPGFKILADEVLLVGTSMGMHYERKTAYPVRATDVQGPLQVLERVLDKRPLLFPFLVSTVHDLTGYRPENAFYVNRALGVCLLILVYVLGWKVTGQRWAGVFTVLLFAGLPLLAQQAAGAGFELLNLLMLVVVALAMRRYLNRPDAAGQEALIYSGLLLAGCRYESILFLIPVAIAAVWGWSGRGGIVMSWPVLMSPLFLVPALIQNRVFNANEAAWQLADKDGVQSPFGFQFLADNLGHALAFFFDSTGYMPSSAFFGAIGLLALPFLGLWVMRMARDSRERKGTDIAGVLMVVGLGALVGVHLFYFWGQYDDPIIHRLSLPLHLLMALAVVITGGMLFKSDFGWRVMSVVAALAAVSWSLPVMARQAYEEDYAPGLETEMRRDFLAAHPEADFLFIDHDSVFWVIHLIPASPIFGIGEKREALSYHLRNHSFSGMYVFQSVLVNDQTGERYVDPEDEVGSEFELETVWERKVHTLLFARISRITAIEWNGEVVAAPRAVPLDGAGLRDADDVEAARLKYLETWIKQLP